MPAMGVAQPSLTIARRAEWTSGNGLSHGSKIRTLGTRGNVWSGSLGSEALKAEAAELEVAEEEKGTSMTRSCVGSRVSAASLTRLNGASPHPMVVSDAACPQQEDQVALLRLFPDQPVPLDNSLGQATTDRHSQTGSLLYPIAPAMAHLCPEKAGEAQGISQSAGHLPPGDSRSPADHDDEY